MRAEERRQLLGDEVIAHIDALVDAAPEPPPEVVEELRRILAPTVRAHAVARARALLATATMEEQKALRDWLKHQDVLHP